MNKFLQARKETYLEHLLIKIASRKEPIEIDGIAFEVERTEMSGTIYLTNEDYPISIYCTPACDQYLGGDLYPEDHDRVDISFEFASEDGESVLDFKLPIALNWHDVDVDAVNYFELVKAALQREVARLKVAA